VIESLMDEAMWIHQGVVRAYGDPASVVARYREHEFGVGDNPFATLGVQPQFGGRDARIGG
jgi:hypothetical protein